MLCNDKGMSEHNEAKIKRGIGPAKTVVKQHRKLSFQWSDENMFTHSPPFIFLNSTDSFCEMHPDLQDSWMDPSLTFWYHQKNLS